MVRVALVFLLGLVACGWLLSRAGASVATECPSCAAGIAAASGEPVGGGLLDTRDFPPRWHCGTWSSLHGWVHIIADLATWAAYMAIPALLLVFLRRRPDAPFSGVFLLFAAFILSCGLTHLMEAVMFWWPAYRLMGAIKAVTAVVSVGTVLALVPVLPKALALRSPAELEREVVARTGELRSSEARFERALRGGSEGVFDVQLGVGGERTFLSERFTALVGWPRDQLPGDLDALLDKIVHAGDRRRLGAVVSQAVSGGAGVECEFRAVASDGTDRWLELRACAERAPDGAPMFSGVVVDIAPRKEQEHEVEAARTAAEAATRAKSEFLANMSHEIRTPMTAILGFGELLGAGDLTGEDRQYALTTLQRSGEYLLRIIDDILDLSKIEAGKLRVGCEPVAVRPAVEAVMELLQSRAHAAGLELSATFSDRLPHVIHTDPVRLRQILVNVTGNALKFTESGSVTIEGDAGEGDDAGLRIDVVDTGLGMSASAVERVFSPFEQADASPSREHGGAGLGLAISRRLAGLLGGRLDLVETRPGCGTRMRLVLPHKSLGATGGADLTSAPPKAVAISPDRLRGRRVLVVDDMADNRALVSRILERNGISVALAANGAEAIERVERAADAGEPFDAILLDMQMPVLDGYTAAGRLREGGYHGAVVALTAHAMVEERERCLAAGCDAFAAKPIRTAELIGLLSGLLA